jgi:hypothetical protein
VFNSGHIGRQVWQKSTDQRFEITGFTSSTEVSIKILNDFASLNIPSDDWYLSTDEITGLHHFEGQNVQVVTDGSVHPDSLVTNGAIKLDQQSSYVGVGEKYRGMFKTSSLELQGFTGSAHGNKKNIHKAAIQFLSSLGASVGADLYRMFTIPFRNTNSQMNRPPELFSGIRTVKIPSGWKRQKHIHVVQDVPLPCNVQVIEYFATMGDQ